MLTVEKLKSMEKHIIFATGTAIDNEFGLFLNGSNKELRWIAITGEIRDWTIYCHLADKSQEWIRRHGDKICMERHIKMCVQCDDEAFKRYRY